MSVWELLVFTVFPGTVLAVTSGLAVWRVRKTGEYRLLFLAGVLAIMLSHQMLEGRSFVLTGRSVGGVPESIETTANTFAAVAVHYATSVFEGERRLRNDLTESERRYRTLMDESPLPVLVHRAGKVAHANAAMATLLAADTPDRLREKPLSETLVGAGEEDVANTIEAVTGEDADRSFAELELEAFDGSERTVLVAGATADESDRERTHLVFRDVTRERQVQRELERTRGRLETTLEHSNDAIFLIDPREAEIVDANPRAAEMLRYDREELVGLSPYEIHPHEASRFDEFVDRVASGGGLTTDELSCLRKDGVEVPAEISAAETTVRGRDCVLAVVRDISDRKRRQHQIQVLERVLRHNLRNEMTVVLGQMEVIESRADDDLAVQATESIRNKCKDLIELSDEIRGFQSVIRSRSAEPQAVELSPLVEDVTGELRREYPDASITVEVPDAATVFDVHPRSLALALSNLVENAIEHAEAPAPAVEVTAAGVEGRRGDWLAVQVRDECPEIPSEERRIVTRPDDLSDVAHGTGLGLWVVGHVVDAIDGEVGFDRRENDRGNVVTLYLRGQAACEDRLRF